jgi:hypothetical protein
MKMCCNCMVRQTRNGVRLSLQADGISLRVIYLSRSCDIRLFISKPIRNSERGEGGKESLIRIGSLAFLLEQGV